jgi:hypothetical protein
LHLLTFFALGLVLRDPMLQDVGNDVEALVVFSLGHEDIAAALLGYVTRCRLWVIEELHRRLA